MSRRQNLSWENWGRKVSVTQFVVCTRNVIGYLENILLGFQMTGPDLKE